ncbi:MAG: glycosyltransferase [Acidobacteriota bacterium]
MSSYWFLGVAAIPFIYYLIAIYSSWRYFRTSRHSAAQGPSFSPPLSILKPVRGHDPGAYENFASFCRQDYPQYEILLCVDPDDQAVLPIVERLRRNFPERTIRVLYGSGRIATNDKVAKLARLVSEAQHEVVVISDSDVRVRPDYLRRVTAPLARPNVGAVTCFYVSVEEKTSTDRLQSIGMLSDFYAGILVAWQLDGIKFALGPTIATTRTRLAGFGGYAAIENRPADDLLVGRLIAEQGVEVVLLPYTIDTVADYGSFRELLHKRLRWIVVMRNLRPWGHFGLIFTHGFAWTLAAIAVHPTAIVMESFIGAYLLLRLAMTAIIAGWGLEQANCFKNVWLIPVWDAVACVIWLVSFSRNSIRWRGADYYIRQGQLVPVASSPESRKAAA